MRGLAFSVSPVPPWLNNVSRPPRCLPYNKDFPRRQVKQLLAKWTHWILAVLSPLGIWGVLGFAFVDAAFLGMPLDAIVGGYVWASPSRFQPTGSE